MANKFREELNALTLGLRASNPHFVHCICPSVEEKKLGYLEPGFVRSQIQHMAVLDSLHVRRAGFPFRETYADFFAR